MWIYILEKNLPSELVHIICKMIHNTYMKTICEILNHKIVWVKSNNKISYLICENQNYYKTLN